MAPERTPTSEVEFWRQFLAELRKGNVVLEEIRDRLPKPQTSVVIPGVTPFEAWGIYDPKQHRWWPNTFPSKVAAEQHIATSDEGIGGLEVLTLRGNEQRAMRDA